MRKSSEVFHGQEVEGMRKKNFKVRCEKRKIGKCAEVCRTFLILKTIQVMGALCDLYKNKLENFVRGWFESIFVSKISTDCDFCFSQDLCPQMALHSLLWA